MPMAVEVTRQTTLVAKYGKELARFEQNANAYAYDRVRRVPQLFPRPQNAISESVNSNHGTSGAILTQTSPPSPPTMNENRKEDRTKDANSDIN